MVSDIDWHDIVYYNDAHELQCKLYFYFCFYPNKIRILVKQG